MHGSKTIYASMYSYNDHDYINTAISSMYEQYVYGHIYIAIATSGILTNHNDVQLAMLSTTTKF